MSIPVDTQKARFMTVGEPYPATDYKTKAPKLDQNGIQIFIVPVMIMIEGQKGTNVNLRHSGPPKGIKAYQYVKLTDFYFSEWEGKDGKGTVYDVGSIEPEQGGRS